MIAINIPTAQKKLSINFDIEFIKPYDLRAVGMDAANKKTVFFDRLVNSDNRFFEMDSTLPLSPKKLLVTFQNAYNDNNAFNILALDINALQNNGVELSHFDYENIEWLKKFCKEASYLPDGMHFSPNRSIWINYMPQIVDEFGSVLQTPARVDHGTGEIQINSTKFKTYTVPVRMMISTHEYAHWAHNNTDETFCDLEGLRICLGYGFPKSECIYTFTKILDESHQNEMRMKQIVNYINNYR